MVHGEAGDYSRAEALFSRAIAMFKGNMSDISQHSYNYSRGVVRLRAGQSAQGVDDLRMFLDGILQPFKDQPASADTVIHKLAYARLLSATTPEDQRNQLRQLLQLITGTDRPIDSELAAWRNWWAAHRTGFQPGPEAGQLSPGGIHESVGSRPSVTPQ